eukprot:gene29361-12452_t
MAAAPFDPRAHSMVTLCIKERSQTDGSLDAYQDRPLKHFTVGPHVSPEYGLTLAPQRVASQQRSVKRPATANSASGLQVSGSRPASARPADSKTAGRQNSGSARPQSARRPDLNPRFLDANTGRLVALASSNTLLHYVAAISKPAIRQSSQLQ